MTTSMRQPLVFISYSWNLRHTETGLPQRPKGETYTISVACWTTQTQDDARCPAGVDEAKFAAFKPLTREQVQSPRSGGLRGWSRTTPRRAHLQPGSEEIRQKTRTGGTDRHPPRACGVVASEVSK